MPRILFRESFAFKYVAQMTATVAADNFNSLTISVDVSIHGATDFIIETRPPAMAAEFIRR